MDYLSDELWWNVLSWTLHADSVPFAGKKARQLAQVNQKFRQVILKFQFPSAPLGSVLEGKSVESISALRVIWNPLSFIWKMEILNQFVFELFSSSSSSSAPTQILVIRKKTIVCFQNDENLFRVYDILGEVLTRFPSSRVSQMAFCHLRRLPKSPGLIFRLSTHSTPPIDFDFCFSESWGILQDVRVAYFMPEVILPEKDHASPRKKGKSRYYFGLPHNPCPPSERDVIHRIHHYVFQTHKCPVKKEGLKSHGQSTRLRSVRKWSDLRNPPNSRFQKPACPPRVSEYELGNPTAMVGLDVRHNLGVFFGQSKYLTVLEARDPLFSPHWIRFYCPNFGNGRDGHALWHWLLYQDFHTGHVWTLEPTDSPAKIDRLISRLRAVFDENFLSTSESKATVNFYRRKEIQSSGTSWPFSMRLTCHEADSPRTTSPTQSHGPRDLIIDREFIPLPSWRSADTLVLGLSFFPLTQTFELGQVIFE